MNEQMAEMLSAIYKIMAKKEFSETIATMLWNIYTENKTKGFTEEQAMQITLSFARSMSSK